MEIILEQSILGLILHILNEKILKHKKSGKHIRIQVDFSFIGKVNTALQLKLIQHTNIYWKSITMRLKKTEILSKIINRLIFFGILNFI